MQSLLGIYNVLGERLTAFIRFLEKSMAHTHTQKKTNTVLHKPQKTKTDGLWSNNSWERGLVWVNNHKIKNKNSTRNFRIVYVCECLYFRGPQYYFYKVGHSENKERHIHWFH